MPDIVVSLKSDLQSVPGNEKGVQRLLERCPWLRKERWILDELTVYALGNKYQFPRFAQNGSGRTLILLGNIRLDDLEVRTGTCKNLSHFTDDEPFNSLFNLWLSKGKESLCGLNGSYSLILWDDQAQEVSVATDAFGSRHIYYLNSNGQTSFSSNLSVLTENPYFSRTLDPQGVVESLRLGYQLEDRTLFQDIKLVPPASLLSVKRDNVRLVDNKRFCGSEPMSDISWKNAVEELHFLLLDSFKKQDLNNGPYIIPLSGGLDSRCLTGLAQELNLKTRYYTYGVKKCRDIQIAPHVAAAAGGKTEILPNKPDYILRRWGEPFLLNGDLRIPTISVFIDFLEQIGPNRGIFISGFMGETVTGSIYPFIDRGNKIDVPDNFYSQEECESLLQITGWRDLVKEIPITLKRIYDDFSGRDYTKKLMLDLVTRQRRFFSFQKRLIEYFGGLIVPFEDVKVVEFFLKMPFMALDNQELYRRFQARYFPKLAKIPSVNYGALLPTVKSVLISSVQSDFKYLNTKYLRGSLRIPSFINGSHPDYPVDHSQAIRHDGGALTAMILDNRDVLKDIFDFGKIQQLIEIQLKGDNRQTQKILAILHMLSGLQVCKNVESLSARTG